MNFFKIKYLIIFSFLFISTSLSAEKVHGLAMHGLAKHLINEQSLPYVNSNAPKGGTLRLGVYGSFDNLNRIAFKCTTASVL